MSQKSVPLGLPLRLPELTYWTQKRIDHRLQLYHAGVYLQDSDNTAGDDNATNRIQTDHQDAHSEDEVISVITFLGWSR